MAQPDTVERNLTQLMEGKPLAGDTPHRNRCNQIMRDYFKAKDSEDLKEYRSSFVLGKQLKTAVITMVYAGDNPKHVPAKYLRYALDFPIAGTTLGPEQRARVKSPITAIRAFCLNCQGNDSVGVRECPAVNCQFWAFRMGNNAFYGKLGEAEVEVSDTELALEDSEEEAQ